MANNSKGISELETFSSGNALNAVIEAPMGSHLKYKYDQKTELFRLHKVLAMGFKFPVNFGFIPQTCAADGDPLDLMVLLEDSLSVGCVAPSRLIGVIEAKQTEKGKTTRNDRLVGVAESSHLYEEVRSVQDLSRNWLTEIKHFFVSYNQIEGRKFEVLGVAGAARALEMVRHAQAEVEGGRHKSANSRGRAAA